jgi:hypothetical protein
MIVDAIPCAGSEAVVAAAVVADIEVANPVDTFASSRSEAKARRLGTLGYSIRARKAL